MRLFVYVVVPIVWLWWVVAAAVTMTGWMLWQIVTEWPLWLTIVMLPVFPAMWVGEIKIIEVVLDYWDTWFGESEPSNI